MVEKAGKESKPFLFNGAVFIAIVGPRLFLYARMEVPVYLLNSYGFTPFLG